MPLMHDLLSSSKALLAFQLCNRLLDNDNTSFFQRDKRYAFYKVLISPKNDFSLLLYHDLELSAEDIVL